MSMERVIVWMGLVVFSISAGWLIGHIVGYALSHF